MLTLIDAAGPFQLPTYWGEVTTAQYCALDRLQLATVEARAGYFAGRPIQVNGLVADALAWLLVEPGTTGGHFRPLDLGQETYLQVESIRALLSTQPIYECYGEVYGLCMARVLKGGEFSQARAAQLARLCAAWPITDTYPAVAHCLAELQRLNEAFAALGEPDETEAGRRARSAGAERLAVFSHLNVARHYAERFGTTIDVIYQRPWQEIALFLLQDKITAEITDTLQQQNSPAHD